MNIGKSNALVIQFFHALIGCDLTPFIFKKGKTSLFNRWVHSRKYEELTEAFQRLSWLTIQEFLPIFYQFIESAFSGDYDGNLDEFRLQSFMALASNNLREIPSTQSGIELHVHSLRTNTTSFRV